MTPRRLAAAAALMLPLFGAAPASAAENILFNCFFPPRHYVCAEFLPEMGRRIEEATEGRVKLRIPPSSLAAPPDQYTGVIGGVMDGAVQFNGFLRTEIPSASLGLLPFVGGESSKASSLALWDTYQKSFADKDEYGKAVLLALFAMNGGDIYSVTDKPIEAVADLAKRKIWAVPGSTANTIAATGSSVVSGPAVQMLEIVSKGVVDGHVGVPQSEVTQYKLTDYTKSVTIFDDKIFQATFSFFVSRDKWDAISPEDQQAIRDALGPDFIGWMGQRQDEIFAQAHQELVDAGVTFVEGKPEFLDALKGLGQPEIDAWIKRVGEMGVDGQAVIDTYRAAQGQGGAG